jgi:hypothetical protein
MQYLGNNHVGFDNMALGFPSIFGCQAIVYHTESGLFGMHDMKSGAGMATQEAVVAGKSTAFVDWIARQAHGASKGIALYGVINRNEQYAYTGAGIAEWSDMLIDLAEQLDARFGFDGPVSGARINSHVKKGGSVYVRFDGHGQECQVSYKRWTKLENDQETMHSPDTQAVLQRRSQMTGEFNSVTLSDTEYDDAYVVRRIGPKPMNMHLIATAKFQEFRS